MQNQDHSKVDSHSVKGISPLSVLLRINRTVWELQQFPGRGSEVRCPHTQLVEFPVSEIWTVTEDSPVHALVWWAPVCSANSWLQVTQLQFRLWWMAHFQSFETVLVELGIFKFGFNVEWLFKKVYQ